MPQSPSISLFTVVMNRLHHLRITLPENLRNNNLSNTEFVVLDYGSCDGVGDYILQNFVAELQSGKLRYFREQATYFDRCKSRNMAASLCSGDVICNVDADNFTGVNFDRYLQNQFLGLSNVFVSALGSSTCSTDSLGRIAMRKRHFIRCGGYDESFRGYGYEDYDLNARLQRMGLTKVVIEHDHYLQAISHGRAERISNEWHYNNLQTLYTQQINDVNRVLLFLFRDGTCEYGLVVENEKGFKFSLAGGAWQKGSWSDSGDHIALEFGQLKSSLRKSGDLLVGGMHFLRAEQDTRVMEESILFNTEIANRYRYHSSEKPINLKNTENGITKHYVVSARQEA